MLVSNQYNARTGRVEGDHLQHVAKMGIHNLVDRVNHSLSGHDKLLTESDLPKKLRELCIEAEKLAAQLAKCSSVPVEMAADYVNASAKLASDAFPILAAELSRREAEAAAAVNAVRASLTGKDKGPVMTAMVEGILEQTNVAWHAEHHAALPAWRTACAVVRDVAANKTAAPRWLTILIAQHKAEKLRAEM